MVSAPSSSTSVTVDHARVLQPRREEANVALRIGEAYVDLAEVVQDRARYGYSRVAARLNARSPSTPAVNHKPAYRVMKANGLLLPKHSGRKVRVHDGKVATLKSDLRFCSDAFEVRCANGERVHVAFALDCCDREVVSFVAEARHLIGVALSTRAAKQQAQCRVPMDVSAT